LVPLVLGSGGALYGATDCGPFSTIFRVDAAANFETVHSFSGTADGGCLRAPLVLANNGSIYGTTSMGGASNGGTVFEIDSAGAFHSVYSYTQSPPVYSDTAPFHFVVAGEDCALYGVANGGPAGGGMLYRLFEPGHLCQRIHFGPLSDRTLGDPPFLVDAAASSSLPVSLRASGSCTVSGDEVTLTGVGACTLTASQAGDAAYEAAAEVSQAFHVYFDFTGFLPPVADAPTLNRVNAGRVVPVPFEIAGSPGPDVLGSALVRRVDCDTLTPQGGFEPAASPGEAAPHRAASNGRYTFSWKTQKTWAGSCRELALELVDDSLHRAYFRFGGSHPSPGRHGRN
jgi:uncharacterized repeat protein (TIGR03803 family)